MDSGTHNFAEYSVTQAKEGKNARNRILLLLLYFAVGSAYFAAILITRLIPLGAILPLLMWILVYFTWRYVQIEHEYTIATGKVTFTEIYGNRTRKVALEFNCRDCSRIAPLNSEYASETEGAELTYDFRGSVSSPDAYFAILTKDNKKAVVYFEGTAKTVKLFKLYNSAATVVSKDLRF